MILFKTTFEAVDQIQKFYQDKDQNSLEFQIKNSSSIYRVEKIAKESLCFSLDAAGQKDYSSFRAFAEQILVKKIPLRKIIVGTLVTTNGTILRNVQLHPKIIWERKSGYFDNTPQEKSAFRPFFPTSEIAIEWWKSFNYTYNHCEDTSLNVDSCTFEKDLRVRLELVMKKVEAFGNISSRKGSIFAEDSTLNQEVNAFGMIVLNNCYAAKVSARKSVQWKNAVVNPRIAQSIEADDLIDLEGVIATTVESTKDKIIARQACLKEVKSVGSATFEDAKIEKLTLKVPLNPICEIILKETTIEELLIEEKESTILEARFMTGLKSEKSMFNFPSSLLRQDLKEDSTGRIGGKPHLFKAGDYIPGVKVIVKGTGKIGKITYVNCQLGELVLAPAIAAST